MALYLVHKVNQGAHIEGRGQSLDLIVRDVRGDYFRCEAEIEVCSREESKVLQINIPGSPMFVLKELGIELRRRKGRRSVEIAYHADWDYQIQRRDYR